ncbi:MAG TPA: RodZ domain-containing protein [Steroidobacteraceae bacterium]|jgi:cytoskeleton protein RodZ|nr:RodZ domain-containing protein [Steroidobacteraceae bacterium]
MTNAAGGEMVRGIGARLRAAREKRGLTVLQAAEKLHVDARILEALEAQDFAALGADVYVRGHLRRYAEAVGESPAELQELYAGSARPAPPDLTRIPRSDSGRRSSPLVLPALLLVVGCALAGLLWWFLNLPHESAQPLSATPPTPASSTSGAGRGAAGANGAAATPERGAATAPAGGSLPTSNTGQMQLDLRFSALSWVEISDADGRRLLHGLYAPGSAREVTGTAPLRVVLGNAPAVALKLNGRPVTTAGLVHRNGSAHLLIDRTGRASAAAARLAHGE